MALQDEHREPMPQPPTSPAAAASAAHQLMGAGRLHEALAFARMAVAGAEVCTPMHGMLATILCRLSRTEEAERVVDQALQLGMGSGDAYDALAHVSIALGRHDRAAVLYRRAAERDPLSARFWYNLASSERALGRTAKAEVACNRSILLDRMAYPSYLLRSELRIQTVESNHVTELEKLLASPGLDERGRTAVGYALAKELDDLGRYDEAFHWFSEAALAKRRRLVYDVSVDENKIRRIIDTYSVDRFRRSDPGETSARFIFIVGLPRTGTTLLERILTGFGEVRTNGETENFSRALLEATPSGEGDIFTRTIHADPNEVARRYAQLALARADTRLIIEKLPHNYLYLGAIHRALPEAKILSLRRSPLDGCFAMYRTLLAAYPFSYDMEDLARYYAAYDRLMTHWRAVLGGHLCEVSYEELVSQPESVGSRVAAHCGLQWSPALARVENNEQACFTASASQVRQPIYRTSVGRWQRYRNHLEPLVRKLSELGISPS
jgi:tetratricopeptide (TPR) repeat protein